MKQTKTAFCFDWYDKSWSDYTDKDWSDFSYWIKHGPQDRVTAYLSGGITSTKITTDYIVGKNFTGNNSSMGTKTAGDCEASPAPWITQELQYEDKTDEGKINDATGETT